MWTAALVLFGVPILILEEYGSDVVGLAQAAIGGALSNDVTPDWETFALPFDVYESEASDVSRWDSAVPIPRRSLLTLGASGSGKSETLKHFVAQLGMDPREPVVVYDHKEDYQEFLAERGIPMIRFSAQGSDVRWNLFAELETEDDADEIARALFRGAEDGDEFFGTAGRQLFAASVKYLARELEEPTNADLKRYWQRTDAEPCTQTSAQTATRTS